MTVTIDDVKTWWNSNPCNVRRSDKPVGSLGYFDDLRSRKFYVEPHIPEFAAYPSWNGKQVLEVGCGLGIDTAMFARNGATVVAVDLSDVSLKLAEQNTLASQVRYRCQFIHGNMERLSTFVPRYRYDLIYSFGAVHHTPDPAAALAEMRKVATKGHTRLKIMLYHADSYRAWEMRRRSEGTEASQGCPVAYLYTQDEARQLVEDAGWDVTSIITRHIFPWQVDAYKEYRYVKAWPWKVVPDTVRLRLAERWGWHLLVEAEAR